MKTMMKTLLVATALISAGSAVQANAATINFNANANGSYFVSTVTSNGYLATENLNEEGNTPLGTNVAVDGQGPSNGTVHLDSWTNDGADSIWTLTQVGGAAFSLNAFDFASAAYSRYSAATLLTLTGTTAANTLVSQTFVPVAGGFQTFAVSSAFSNVTNVKFDAFGALNRSAYDNIVVNAAAVPEPATWAMMLVGFGMMSASMRYRRRSTNAVYA